jgi:hypothetical protein
LERGYNPIGFLLALLLLKEKELEDEVKIQEEGAGG